MKNKYGIVVTSNLNIHLNVLEENHVTVTIENTSDVPHVLKKGCFMIKKAQSQLELIQPRKLDTTSVLNPSTTLTCIFKCKAKFVGTSEELFIFSFKDFEIGRVFRITVYPLNVGKKICSETSSNRPSNRHIPDSHQWNETTYIPGIRPCKPPPFIKVRNTIFKVPKRYWDLILQCINEGKSQTETIRDVENAVPVLLERLTFQSYKDRFHALLYLEEIAQEIEIQRYNIESVILRSCGEYLVMEVPGLAEKRPSLIIGDRAIVSFKWDSSEGMLVTTNSLCISRGVLGLDGWSRSRTLICSRILNIQDPVSIPNKILILLQPDIFKCPYTSMYNSMYSLCIFFILLNWIFNFINIKLIYSSIWNTTGNDEYT